MEWTWTGDGVGLEVNIFYWGGLEIWREIVLGLGLKVKMRMALECGGERLAIRRGTGQGTPLLGSSGTGLSAMPVRMLMMTLEKSSMGVLVLVKKTMFMRMMQRQKLEVLAMRRKAQAKSSKSGEGRKSGHQDGP